MSMPYSIYECDCCHKRWASLVAWGYFIYRLDGGDWIHCERSLGWCHACDGLAAIEDLGAAIATNVEPAPKLIGLLSRLATKLNTRKESVAKSETAIISEWRLKRQSPARCLSCGSTDIAKLPSEVEPTLFAMTHQGCGGTIHRHESEERIALRAMTRAYTSEGEFISETIGEPE